MIPLRLPQNRTPTHPGEILLEEFLQPLGMTQVGLARLFGTTPEFWLNGQMAWDLWHALHSPTAAELEKIEPVVVGGPPE